jgi:hypothetical protein
MPKEDVVQELYTELISIIRKKRFAPHFNIAKKDQNQMAFEAAKLELENRRTQPNAPGKTIESSKENS